MVIIQPETEVKLKSAKQEALIYKLLQSKVFSKKEFEAFYKKVAVCIVTSYDATVCLNYLLSSIRFRKTFTGKKCRAHAKCLICKATEDLVRYCEAKSGKQVYYCKKCDFDLDEARLDMQTEAIKNAKEKQVLVEPVEKVLVGLDEKGNIVTHGTGEAEPGMFLIHENKNE